MLSTLKKYIHPILFVAAFSLFVGILFTEWKSYAQYAWLVFCVVMLALPQKYISFEKFLSAAVVVLIVSNLVIIPLELKVKSRYVSDAKSFLAHATSMTDRSARDWIFYDYLKKEMGSSIILTFNKSELDPIPLSVLHIESIELEKSFFKIEDSTIKKLTPKFGKVFTVFHGEDWTKFNFVVAKNEAPVSTPYVTAFCPAYKNFLFFVPLTLFLESKHQADTVSP